MRYYDAHNHLHDERFGGTRSHLVDIDDADQVHCMFAHVVDREDGVPLHLQLEAERPMLGVGRLEVGRSRTNRSRRRCIRGGWSAGRWIVEADIGVRRSLHEGWICEAGLFVGAEEGRIEGDADSATKYSLLVAEGIEREAEPRAKVQVVRLGNIRSIR